MSKNKTKLELTWIGKDNRPKLEPRILLEDPELSYHAEHRISDKDIFDNRLIFGDNLLALRALDQELSGKVKCVYIDPPFNTGEAFEHYDDGMEHSLWLSLMRDRIEILHKLLSVDGSIFVHIDDHEISYLSAIMDEIFGRQNKVSIVTFKQGSATGHKSINPGLVTTTNFILIYAKDKSKWIPNRLFTQRARDNRYSQFIVNYEEHYSQWTWENISHVIAKNAGVSPRNLKKSLGDQYESYINKFVLDNADRVIRTARPDYNSVGEEVKAAIDCSKENPEKVILHERSGYSDMYFKNGERILFYKNKLKKIDGKLVPGEPLTNLWDDLLSNNLHNEGGVRFPKGKKPEGLLKRIIEISTKPGDLVFDSFAGSGTTGAVAHKMGRRWIMVELGDHCLTHIVPRLKRLIDGQDNGGITNAVAWKGGGGFRYYRLAPSLLEKDRWGNWVISRDYNATMLSEAMCMHEGFTYAPSESEYWRHGHSTETDFIYVTTQTLTHGQLQAISDEVGDDRTLLICCSAFRARAADFPNLTLKKIPNTILHRCEFGRDDYSLEIRELPDAPIEPGTVSDMFSEEELEQ